MALRRVCLGQLDRVSWGGAWKPFLLSPPPGDLSVHRAGTNPRGPGKLDGIKTKVLQPDLLGSNPTPSVTGYGASPPSFPICKGGQITGPTSEALWEN